MFMHWPPGDERKKDKERWERTRHCWAKIKVKLGPNLNACLLSSTIESTQFVATALLGCTDGNYRSRNV